MRDDQQPASSSEIPAEDSHWLTYVTREARSRLEIYTEQPLNSVDWTRSNKVSERFRTFAENLTLVDFDTEMKALFDTEMKALADCLRLKNGLRIFGNDESDIPDFDRLLIKLWREMVLSRQHQPEQKKAVANALLNYWFTDTDSRDLLCRLRQEDCDRLLSFHEVHSYTTDECREHGRALRKLCFQQRPGSYVDNDHSPTSRSQKKFLSIAKRFASINPSYLESLERALTSTDSLEQIIQHLHEHFARVADDYYAEINDETQGCVDQLATHYLNKINGTQQERFNQYWEKQKNPLTEQERQQEIAFNRYVEALIAGLASNEVKARQLEFQKVINDPQFTYKKLEHDAQHIAARINALKVSRDAELERLRTEINYLAQFYHVKLAINTQEVHKLDPPFATHQKATGLASKAEQDFRCLFKRIDRASKVVAFMVAVGEGFVAAAGMLMLGMAPAVVLPLAVLTFIAGFLANYFLIRMDARDTLLAFLHKEAVKDENGKTVTDENGKTVIARKIFIDKNGQLISQNKRNAICLSTSFAVSAGFVYGAVSAISIYKTVFLPLLFSLGTSHGIATLLAASAAGGFVAFTVVGLASILFAVSADWIKNDRYQQIKAYFKRTYFPDYWSELTTKEKWIFCLVHTPFNLLKLAIGVILNFLITVASLGVFHANGVAVLQLFACPNTWANFVAWVPAALNGVLGVVFGAEKLGVLIQPITLRNIATLLPKLPLGVLEIGLIVAITMVRLPIVLALRKLGVFDKSVTLGQATIPWLSQWRESWNNFLNQVAQRYLPGVTFCELMSNKKFYHEQKKLAAPKIDEALLENPTLTTRQKRFLTVHLREDDDPVNVICRDVKDKLGLANLVLIGSVFLNGGGQMYLFRTPGGDFLEVVLGIGAGPSKMGAMLSEFSYSCSANFVAVHSALEAEAPVETPDGYRRKMYELFTSRAQTHDRSLAGPQA